MKPAVYIKGELQPDDGEAWAFANNVRMVEWDEPVDWDFGTEKPIGWQRRKCPAPMFDGMTYVASGIKNVLRRVPSPAPNPLDGTRLWDNS